MVIYGSVIGVNGDTRSLDYSSHVGVVAPAAYLPPWALRVRGLVCFRGLGRGAGAMAVWKVTRKLPSRTSAKSIFG